MDLALPFVRPDVAPIPARVRERPEDFFVEELPAYAATGEGEHVLVEVEKRGLSTHAALDALARELSIERSACGHAGLKDAHALTRQWLSLRGTRPEEALGVELEGLRVLRADWTRTKLRPGHLRGNRFRLRLRGVPAEREDDVQAVLELLVRRGLPNAFGPQRFGSDGENARRGRELVRGGGARRRLPRERARLYVSAYQAWLFQRVLARRFDAFDGLLAGDLAWLHGNGAVFVVQDPGAEAQRARSFELSASGPLFGPEMIEPRGEPLEIERGVLAEEGLAGPDLGARGALSWKGARRPLRVPVRGLECVPARDAHGAHLQLSFELPPGSYATALLRELTKRDD